MHNSIVEEWRILRATATVQRNFSNKITRKTRANGRTCRNTNYTDWNDRSSKLNRYTYYRYAVIFSRLPFAQSETKIHELTVRASARQFLKPTIWGIYDGENVVERVWSRAVRFLLSSRSACNLPALRAIVTRDDRSTQK